MSDDEFLAPIKAFRWGPQSHEEAVCAVSKIAMETGGLRGLGRRFSRYIRVPFRGPDWLDMTESDMVTLQVAYTFVVEVWNEDGVIIGEVKGRPPAEVFPPSA